MSKWQEKTKRPVLPVYMAALVWPIMALLVPIYTLGGLVLTAAVSTGAYFAGTKLCPTRVVRTYVPYATGSEDVDAMLNGIAANLDGLDCGLVLLHDLAVLLGGLRSGFGAFDSVLHLPNVPQGLVQLRAC